MKSILPVVAVLLMAGCASYYEKSADRDAEPIVRRLQETVRKELPDKTPEGVLTPKPEGPTIPSAPVESTTTGPLEILTLQQTLATAFSTSRDYQLLRENLYLSALSFTLTRHQYEWRPSGSLSGNIVAEGGKEVPDPEHPGEFIDTASTSADASATLALARRLLSGGAFTLSGTAGHSNILSGAGDGDEVNASSLSASFSQPLLAGAGKAAREGLVQATRSLLYDARSFELQRQQISLDVVSDYYDLLRQRQVIKTARAQADRSAFLLDRSRALFDKGMAKKVDVLRAEQQQLQDQNSLSNRRADYALALDRFKITLGIPTDKSIDVADEPIEPRIVAVNVEAAVKTALANRLDLLTEKQQLVDTERRLEIARNALLPELDFVASARGPSRRGDILDFTKEDASISAGLTLILPLDRKAERNAYRQAIIGLARARRDYQLAEDNVVLRVRETVRNLQQAEITLYIQKQSLSVARDQVEAAQLDFDRGKASNRDIVEAQNNLQTAENAYVQAQVSYLIGYMSLLKDMGTLRVDEQGRMY